MEYLLCPNTVLSVSKQNKELGGYTGPPHSPDSGHCQGDDESLSPPVNYADITPQMIASFFLVFLFCAFRSLLEMSM